MGAGIDYSHGMTNVNHETGIHFGVISQHTPCQWIWEDFEGVYWHGCPKCEMEFDDATETQNDDGDEECPGCGYQPHSEDEWWGDEAVGQAYDNSDPNYVIEYSELLCSFYVEQSPFYTLAPFCSPCAPGAASLDSPDPDGVKCYCLGIDFFDKDSPCPYPIYSVETNELLHGQWEETETE